MMSSVTTEGQAAARKGSRSPEEGGSPRLGYLLKQAQLRFTEMASAALAPLGIGPREWAALNCLDEQHGLSQREVAELLGVDRTTMVALIDDLERDGHVDRDRNPDDRRAYALSATAGGKRLQLRAAAVMKTVYDEALSPLTSAEIRELRRMLRAIVESGTPT